MDTIQFHTLLDIIVGVALPILSLVIKSLWGAIKELENDMKKLNADLNDKFTRKDDFRKEIAELKDMLERLFDKLDGKADK